MIFSQLHWVKTPFTPFEGGFIDKLFPEPLGALGSGCEQQFWEFTQAFPIESSSFDMSIGVWGLAAVMEALNVLDNVAFVDSPFLAMGDLGNTRSLGPYYLITLDLQRINSSSLFPADVPGILETTVLHELAHVGLLELGLPKDNELQHQITPVLVDMYKSWKKDNNKAPCVPFS